MQQRHFDRKRPPLPEVSATSPNGQASTITCLSIPGAIIAFRCSRHMERFGRVVISDPVCAWVQSSHGGMPLRETSVIVRS